MRALFQHRTNANMLSTTVDEQYEDYLKLLSLKRQTEWVRWENLGKLYEDQRGLLVHTVIYGLNLSYFNFAGLNLDQTAFVNCDLEQCNFNGARLHYASFHGCNLYGVNFDQAATLEVVSFVGCSLRDCKGVWQFGPIGSRQDVLTAMMLQNQPEMSVYTGCFRGRLSRFANRVRNTHSEESLARQQYEAIIALLKATQSEIRTTLGLHPDPDYVEPPVDFTSIEPADGITHD